MSSDQVASHYNAVPNKDKFQRTDSRIYYQRNFNNWIKSCLIAEFNEELNKDGCKAATVLDLCCGKGGDLLKWRRANIKEIVMADIAGVSLEACQSRYEEMRDRRTGERPFKAQFITIDLTKEKLQRRISDPSIEFDIVSCQFALHYSFRTEQGACRMLQNVTDRLRSGGYFIGTLPDANRLIHLLRQGGGVYQNEVVKVEYTDKSINIAEEQPPLFGAEFTFNLDEVVNCPEYLAYFPLLTKMLEEFGMELVYCKTFPEAIEHFLQRQPEEAKALLTRMSALEPYKPGNQLKGSESEYMEAAAAYKERVVSLRNEIEVLEQSRDMNGDDKSKRFETDRLIREKKRELEAPMGVLSKSEWEVISMYLVFVFQKK